jgi:hypothetical protein
MPVDPATGRWYDPPPGGNMPPPNIPLDPPSQAGGGGGGAGQGGTWYTGYGGASPGGQSAGGGLRPYDWQGLQNWDDRTSGYFDKGVAALTGFSPVSSNFGQSLYSLFSSGQGFTPELLARLKTQAAEMNAGSTQNTLQRQAGRDNATGFGNSAASNYAQSQIRGQGAQNLQRGLTELDVQNQLMGLQRQLGTGGLLANLYGQQAGMQGQLANMWANRQAPMYPSSWTGGSSAGAPGSPWWTQGGKYQTGPQQPDPFAPAGKGYTPGNPWSPW